LELGTALRETSEWEVRLLDAIYKANDRAMEIDSTGQLPENLASLKAKGYEI
jgi:hypothetical protein